LGDVEERGDKESTSLVAAWYFVVNGLIARTTDRLLDYIVSAKKRLAYLLYGYYLCLSDASDSSSESALLTTWLSSYGVNKARARSIARQPVDEHRRLTVEQVD